MRGILPDVVYISHATPMHMHVMICHDGRDMHHSWVAMGLRTHVPWMSACMPGLTSGPPVFSFLPVPEL